MKTERIKKLISIKNKRIDKQSFISFPIQGRVIVGKIKNQNKYVACQIIINKEK